MTWNFCLVLLKLLFPVFFTLSRIKFYAFPLISLQINIWGDSYHYSNAITGELLKETQDDQNEEKPTRFTRQSEDMQKGCFYQWTDDTQTESRVSPSQVRPPRRMFKMNRDWGKETKKIFFHVLFWAWIFNYFLQLIDLQLIYVRKMPWNSA